MRRTWPIAVAVLVLAGCSQGERPRGDKGPPESAPVVATTCATPGLSTADGAAFIKDDACTCAASDARINPIRSKLLMDPANVDPTMMVVADPPYKTDKLALRVNAKARNLCYTARLAAMTNAPDAALFQAKYARYEAVYAALLNGEMTYGQANQELRAAYMDFVARRTPAKAAKPAS